MEMKTTVLAGNLRFPEVPRWHDGKLWFCDFFTQRVMNVDLQGHVQTVFELNDTPAGLDWTPNGQLLVVSGAERRLLRLADDGLVEVADLSGLVTHPCNELIVDRQGRAYIGNMGFDFGDPQAAPQPGAILLLTPEPGLMGEARIAAGGLAFPNGMVITPDGRTLIVAESYASRLTAFDIELDGTLSNRRVWAQLIVGASEAQITPDGICLDAEGAVWAASPGSGEVIRVREGGEITHRISLDNTPLAAPAAIPLACILGGPERRTLFISTTESLDFNDQQAQGRIETIQVDVPGAGLP